MSYSYYAHLTSVQPNQNLCIKLGLEMGLFHALVQDPGRPLDVSDIMRKHNIQRCNGLTNGSPNFRESSGFDLVGKKLLSMFYYQNFGGRSNIPLKSESCEPWLREVSLMK